MPVRLEEIESIGVPLMPQTDKKRKRTDAVRQCQAKRREHLKALTVEVNKENAQQSENAR